MLMSDKEIMDAVTKGELVIEPFHRENLEPCSYDAHLGSQALISNHDDLINVAERNSISLDAGDFALVITEERFELPRDIAAHIGMRSSLARQGLVLLAGMQIDPTFKGHLRLGFYNASPRRLTVDYHDEICMIEFHRLREPVQKVMREFPELMQGKIPSSDRAFLRQLETTSLSDLAKNIAALTSDVAALTREVRSLATYMWPLYVGIFLTLLGATLSLILR
jgi:dCTP deaminase